MSADPDLDLARTEARLLKFISAIELPRDRLTVETEFAGRPVSLVVFAVGEGWPAAPPIASTSTAIRKPRSDCERDILALLATRPPGEGLTRAKIIEALADADRLWGDSTIANALASMTADGLLENSRKRGGYFVP